MKKRKTTIIIAIVSCFACLIAVIFYFNRNDYPKNIAKNVLVITLDTTRADRIGIYGYEKARTPNIDNLARNGLWFDEAFSSVPITLPSHCSIFTGTYVLYHQVRNNGSYFLPGKINTLAEILKNKNYITSAFISSFTLDSRFGLNRGFDLYNDNLILNQTRVKTFDSERPAELVFKDFSTWFNKNYNKKFFSWIHFYDPHLPYSPPEPYKSQFQTEPYDGEIAYMDEYIGKILSLLKEKKLLDNTLIVIAGDHGEAFGEHGELGHGFFCYQESLNVPLIFYSQDEFPKNKKVTQRVNLSDIMPTILDYLDIKIPNYIQGKSLLPYINKNIPNGRSFYVESVMPYEVLGCAIIKGIIKNNYKYLDLPRPELYNLETDPFEKKNLYVKKIQLAKSLQGFMKKLESSYNTLKPDSKRKLSDKEIKKLRSLGYLSSTKRRDSSKKLPDPKDKIKGWNECIKGSQYFSQGRTDDAIQCFKKSIELNNEFSEPYAMLAFINYKKGNIEEAEALYKKGIEINSDDYILRMEYIKLLIFQKEFTEALKKLRELEDLKLIAFEVEIFNLSGMVYMNMNYNTEAIFYFKKALKKEPENHSINIMLARCLNRQNKFSEALNIFLELEKSTPDDSEFMLDIAMTYGELKKYERSKSYFKKLLEKNPLPIIYYYYAVILSRIEEYEEAVKNMRKFANLYTKDDSQRKKALDCIETWSQHDNNTIRLKKAFALQRSGKPEEALKIYLQLEKIDPNDFNLVFNMAMVYGMMGKYSKSSDYFKRGIKIKSVPVIYFNYAFFLSKAGRYSEAIKNMKQFLEIYPKNDATRQSALQFIENMKTLKRD